MRISIVIFAQAPPPEHGQSRMVLMALETLRDKPESFEVHHINARFSNSLEDIGESSVSKMLLTAKYLYQAIRIRGQVENPILYYIPGPVKWSSVLRDWVLLFILRLFYRRVVFHWHAIGHGEWAHGSERLKLKGPCWTDSIARKISAWVLDEPFASIAVSATSQKDSLAVASKRNLIVNNGIEDPCPAFEKYILPLRAERCQKLVTTEQPCFKVLFLSHGTLEKGTIDALDCMERLLEHCDPSWCFLITFVGGISGSIVIKFNSMVDALRAKWPERIQIIQKDYLTGDDKYHCFVDHDIFLAPSRWESFGLTVVEAMAHGMQVVAAASDGVKGVLPEGHPYLSPPADPTALADRLLQCCSDLRAAHRLEAGNALRQRFLNLYQLKDFTGNLTEAIINLGEGSELSKGDELSPIDSSFSSSNQQSTISSNIEHRTSNIEHRNEESEIQHLSSSDSSLSDLNDLAFQSSSSPNDPSHLIGIDAHRATLQASQQISVHPRSSAVQSSSSSSNQRSKITNHQSSISPSSSSSQLLHLTAYLADQNPGHDRSFGISRMSQIILETLQAVGQVDIETIASKTSQQGSERMASARVLPWGTRRKWVRLLTDHFHPLFHRRSTLSDVYYFPKGYLPLIDVFCQPSVVTIHDTIIQYDADHYPNWRSRWEYGYWSKMLKHTLRKANRILTVSESAKNQVQTFMDRHRIPRKEITVTYEPCLYEKIPQPENPAKENYVIHLASCEPHKRTAHLIRWWYEAEQAGRTMPMLHLIGQIPPEVSHLLASSHSMAKRPFLEDAALQDTYQEARALILPSEIEGFGLPALEAYYLGTPVCYVKGTSVEEVLCTTTRKGGFSLDSADTLFAALDEVMTMSADEIRKCGLKLRETYAAEKVVERMLSVFHEVKYG